MEGVASQQTAKIPSQRIAGGELRSYVADRRAGYEESGARRLIESGRRGQELPGFGRRVSAPEEVQAPFWQGLPKGRGITRRGHGPARDEEFTKVPSKVVSRAKRDAS